ncbi:MAG: hypothetical protein P4L99_28175 [Chthoniobacter sp.]|nr:hypothetical protein [Chthoniobacter sp.]
MKLLLDIDQRHPGIVAVVGGTSGLMSWFIAHSPEIASVAGAVGAIATAGIAVVSLARILCRGIANLVYAVRRRIRNRAQRRSWKRLEPVDDHLDLTPP